MSVELLSPGRLHETARDILLALGTPLDSADVVARSLVDANQVGHESHGIVRLIEYASFVEHGQVAPAAVPTVASEVAAVSTVDGNHGWGQLAATFAARCAGDAAEKYGIGTASARNCNHIGRIGEYAEHLARRGLASIIWCNADPVVAPFGGRERKLGTNPFAVGIPVDGTHPFILDFATSQTAEGKLRVARAAGHDIAPGAVIDSEGRPSTDPNDFYDGGALLTFGAHKGYAMSAFVDLLGGGLSGNHPATSSRYRVGNGVVVIAMNPPAFAATDFGSDITEAVTALRASSPIDPEYPVLIPGDLEADVRKQRIQEIPVTTAIWKSVIELRDRYCRSA